MSLHPPTSRRERILAYGLNGSGKTSTLLDVATWIANTQSSARIHVGSTDYKWEPMITPEIEPIVTVTNLDRDDFMPWIEWARSLKTKVSRDDWVSVDLIDVAWEAAQQFYWDKVTGGDLLADIWFRNQEAINSKGAEGEYMAGSNGGNWGLIKKYYFSFLQAVINVPCHLLFVAQAKEVPGFGDQEAALKAKWKTGWMPAGEKTLPGVFFTWLYCAETPKGWIYTSTRDDVPLGQPKRRLLKGEVIEAGFVLDYLVGVCGWEL